MRSFGADGLAAGLGMALSSLLVVLNAARLSRPPAMPAPSKA
jgi:hypothetical protein